MKYKNTKTGAIIDSPCIISGGDWVREGWAVQEEDDGKIHVRPTINDEVIDTPIEAVEVVEEIEEDEEVIEEKDGFDGITVKQIKQELDAFGIQYDPKARKQELYDLMIKGR